MADALKTFYDGALVARLAATMVKAWPRFPRERFVGEAGRGLQKLELMARAAQLARALGTSLPADRKRALQILIRSLGPERADTQGEGMAGFFYLPHVLFVASEGLDHFEEAMEAQHQLTRRFTAEYSIRPYLERYPAETLERLRRWANDPNPHVRRLVSEGTRPRLPWAPRLRGFQADPTPVVELLELLKDDPERYVQRSVANNLNDIGKDHPETLFALCRRWGQDAPGGRAFREGRAWIIRHALRSRIKAGERPALAILGFGSGEGWTAEGLVSPARIDIGQRATVVLTVKNGSRRRASACVDLAVHFVKASGQARPKVFKGQELTLDAGASAQVRKSIWFAVQTTRVPRPGVHQVDALINGSVIRVGNVVVQSPRAQR